MNKIMKKTIAAAMALTIVGGGIPALSGGIDIFKPAIVANAAYAAQTLDSKTGVLTIGAGEFAGVSENYRNNANVKSIVFEKGAYVNSQRIMLFRECLAETIDLTNLDTSASERMDNWFWKCSNLKHIEFGDIDTSKVKYMQLVFSGCSSLEDVDLSKFDTSNVMTMHGMFVGCSSLKKLDLTSFDTSSLTKIGGMFSGCESLERVVVSDKWDNSNITESSGVFYNCRSLTGGLGTKLKASEYSSASSDGKKYARIDRQGESGLFSPMYSIIEGASLTLDSEIGVNFYVNVTDDVAKAVFRGPNGDMVIPRDEFEFQDDGTAKLTYPINATQTKGEIKMRLSDGHMYLPVYNSNLEIPDEDISFSAQTYFDNAEKAIDSTWSNRKIGAFEDLVGTVHAYAEISEAYFKGDVIDDVSPEEEAYLLENTDNATFSTEDGKISLVLDSKLAARLYIKDKPVEAGAAATYVKYDNSDNEWKEITAKSGGKAGVYFEIPGIAPTDLRIPYRVSYGGRIYNFTPLTWSRRVMLNPNSTDRSKSMADALFKYYETAVAFVHADDLDM